MLLTIDSHHARLLSTIDGSTTSGSNSLSHPRKKSKTYIYGSFTGHQKQVTNLEQSRYIYECTKAGMVNPNLIMYVVMGFARACSKV
jgi:hypothetical protein